MSATIEAVSVDPAAVTEAKAYLRIENSGDDALLERLTAAAIAVCEGFTGTVLIARAARETIAAGGDWRRLALTPVRTIGAVAHLAINGTASALAVDGFAIDIDAGGDGWVRVTQPGPAARATVQYQAGQAADWTELPEPLRQGVVRLVAHLYTHRDAAGDAGPPVAVAALWRPWRRMRIR